MAYKDDDDSSYNGSSHSYGSSSRSKTSSFNTSNLLGDKDHFLGVKLSPQIAEQMRVLSPALTDYVRRFVEEKAVPMAEHFGKMHLGYTDAQAMRFGSRTASALGYGVIFSEQLADLANNFSTTTSSMNALTHAIKPVTDANKQNAAVSAIFGGSDNEVINNARGKINGIFWQRLSRTITGAVRAIPNLMFKLHDEHNKNLQRQKDIEFASVKEDPEKLAAWYEKELGFKGAVGSAEEAKAMDAVLKKMRDEYKAKYELFKKENFNRVKTDLEKEFLEEVTEASPPTYSQLSKLGFSERDFSKREFPEVKYGEEGYGKTIFDVTAYKKRVEEKVRKIAEEHVKGEFVRTNGAFDDEWAKYYNKGLTDSEIKGVSKENRITITDDFKKRHKDWVDRNNGVVKDLNGKIVDPTKPNKETNELARGAAGLGAGILGEMFTSFVGGKTLEKYQEPIALDRILHLRRVIEKAEGGKLPEMVSAPEGAKNERDCSYAKFVHQIFEQHQKDCKRADIGDRFFTHFEKAGWSDEKIQEIPDEQLSAYEYAVKTISNRIKLGQMDAIALVNIVGSKKARIVQESGKDFGPAGAGADDAKVKEAIAGLIDQQTTLFHPNVNMDEMKVNEALGAFVFSVDEIKQAFGPNGLKGDERAFLFTLLEFHIPNKGALCKVTGMTEDQCDGLRKECQQQFNALLDASVAELLTEMEKDPKLVEKLQLTDAERRALKAANNKREEDGKPIAETASREELKEVEAAVAGAVMEIDHKEGKGSFWARVKDTLSGHKKEKEEKAEEKAAAKERGDEDEFKSSKKHDKHKKHDDLGFDGEDDFADKKHSRKHRKDDFDFERGDDEKPWSERVGRSEKRGFSMDDFDEKPSFAKRHGKRGGDFDGHDYHLGF